MKSNLKKALSILAASAVLTLSLAGCGGDPQPPADAGESGETAVLSGAVSTNGSTSMEKVIGVLSEQFMADNSGVTVTYDPTGSGAVIEAVKSNPNAIGYASLSSAEGQEGIQLVTVGGVACTEETVLDGSYAIQRPFVMVTRDGAALSEAAQAFFDFATSSAANDLIRTAGAVPVA